VAGYKDRDAFAASNEQYEQVRNWLTSAETRELRHEDVERQLDVQGRELLRQLFQDHLDLRSEREPRQDAVEGTDGVVRGSVEQSERQLLTIFGTVRVRRLAYRARGAPNLHPADAVLNLPAGKYSYGLRKQAAQYAAQTSYDTTLSNVAQATGQSLGKRQLEASARAATADFEAFYARGASGPCGAEDVLVITVDSKGIVMRPDALRDCTKKYAEGKAPKLLTRGSRGEPRGRKRMATVGAVYDVAPFARTAEDVLASSSACKLSSARPKPRNKRCTVSIVKDLADVVTDLFDEAQRRDPDRRRRWLVLVDGDWRLLRPIAREAKQRGVAIDIVIDFVHVLEYLWKAAWCFFKEGDPAAERWVRKHALDVLRGRSSIVAGAIRRKATALDLSNGQRKNADRAADYLIKHAAFLHYDRALAAGYPIATGVIEGACRHLVKDRMDITGARWSLAGAEAVLQLRTLLANGDFDDYWRFHLDREYERVHHKRFEGLAA